VSALERSFHLRVRSLRFKIKAQTKKKTTEKRGTGRIRAGVLVKKKNQGGRGGCQTNDKKKLRKGPHSFCAKEQGGELVGVSPETASEGKKKKGIGAV